MDNFVSSWVVYSKLIGLFCSYFFVTSKELSTAIVREVRLVCEPPDSSVADNNNFSLNIGEVKVCIVQYM